MRASRCVRARAACATRRRGRTTSARSTTSSGSPLPVASHIRRRMAIGGAVYDLHADVAPASRDGGPRRARRRALCRDRRPRPSARATTDHDVYDLEVAPTHTYVANGLLVHNCVYRFRGADFRNIMQFEEAFPEVTTVVLDQNYRSTQTILDAANAVIANNAARKPKNLWTDAGSGDRIIRYHAEDEGDEATFVASTARQLHDDDASNWRELAVLYRTNAQSRVVEEAMMRLGVPVQGRRRHALLRPARGQGRDGLPAGGRQPGRRGQRQARAQRAQARRRRRQHRQARRARCRAGHRVRRGPAPGRRRRCHGAGDAWHRVVRRPARRARRDGRRRRRRAGGPAAAALDGPATSPSWRPRTPSSPPGGWRTSASSSARHGSSPSSTSSSSRWRSSPTPTTSPTTTRSC